MINDSNNNLYLEEMIKQKEERNMASLMRNEEIYDNLDNIKNSIKNSINNNFNLPEYSHKNINKIIGGNSEQQNEKNERNNDVNINFEVSIKKQVYINKVEWKEEINSYIIFSNSEIECIITNDDILKNMIDNNNIYIKKYIYTLSFNPVLEVNEFNFINSIFTSNLDIIIKFQNFIYDTININLTQNNKNSEVLLFFYYQLIIWLFKNMTLFENNLDNNSNKISKVFSSLILN